MITHFFPHSNNLGFQQFLIFRFLNLFFRKSEDGIETNVFSFDKSLTRRKKIRCPLCSWEPKSSSTWVCRDIGRFSVGSGNCGTQWNTFDTHGLCPGCSFQWIWTACLNCHRLSLHEDWYEENRPKNYPGS